MNEHLPQTPTSVTPKATAMASPAADVAAEGVEAGQQIRSSDGIQLPKPRVTPQEMYDKYRNKLDDLLLKYPDHIANDVAESLQSDQARPGKSLVPALCGLAGLILVVAIIVPFIAFKPCPDHGSKLNELAQTQKQHGEALERLEKQKLELRVPPSFSDEILSKVQPIRFEDGTDLLIVATHATRSGLDARPHREAFLHALGRNGRGPQAGIRTGFALAQSNQLAVAVPLAIEKVQLADFGDAPNATESLDAIGDKVKEAFDPKRGDQRVVLVVSSLCTPFAPASPGWNQLSQLDVVVVVPPGKTADRADLERLREWHQLVGARGSVALVQGGPAEKEIVDGVRQALERIVPGGPRGRRNP